MGTVYKETFTKPLPAGAKVIVRNGQRFAEWKPAKGKTRTARLTVGKDGTDRIVITAATYTAKYRDGSGVVRKTSTGCRDEAAARSALADLERRAEKVKGKILTVAEDAMIDHQVTPLADHLTAYLVHLQAKGNSAVHLDDTRRLATVIAAGCGFDRLATICREAVEAWLVQRTAENMAARTRNSYLQALRGFCNWCIETGRLAVNPLARIAKADETADRRRQRRALTEAELIRLLDMARRRPLAEYGRLTEAWRLGIHPEKAAIAFGCNVRTMMAHYIAMDETATADEVLTAIAHVVQPNTNGTGMPTSAVPESTPPEAPPKLETNGNGEASSSDGSR